MAWRLDEYLLEGQFNNTKPKIVTGYLLLRGWDMPVLLQLVGDAHPSLRGRSFVYRPAELSLEGPVLPKSLAPQQVGAIGDMRLRAFRVPRHPIEDIVRGLAPMESDWRVGLSLEWYSQNGRVVLQLADVEVEPESGPSFEPIPVSTDPDADVLTPRQTTFEQSVWTADDPESASPDDEAAPEQAADFLDDDMFTSLTIETEDSWRCDKERRIADMEYARDEAFLFEPPSNEDAEVMGDLLTARRLPDPADIDEAEAEETMQLLVGELARFSVAIHLCEHCTWREAYAWLLREIIQEGRIPKDLARSGWTQNYLYGESCPKCQNEIERRYGSPGDEEPHGG